MHLLERLPDFTTLTCNAGGTANMSAQLQLPLQKAVFLRMLKRALVYLGVCNQ